MDAAAWRESAQRRIDEMGGAAQTVMRGPAPAPESSRFPGTKVDIDPQTGKQRALPYRRYLGVAMIDIVGSLINRGAWVGAYSGAVSYEGIKEALAAAAADSRTHAIILDIESPGGEAVGAFEVADAVRAAREQKPVVAVVNGMAASAAYAIASGATHIVTTSTGVSGSIGVVLLHADYSRSLDKKGITPTLIFAGAHKVDGNPFEPLPDTVRADLQREVDHFYSLFVDTVAAGRAGMSTEAIRATQARSFIGAEAVAAGLADSVGTFEEVLAELSTDHTIFFQPIPKGIMMNNAPAAPAAETVTKSEHEAAIAALNVKAAAETKAAHDKARAEALAEGARAEAARQTGIDQLVGNMKGHEQLVANMKADPNVTIQQAAVRLLNAENATRAGRVNALKAVETTVAGKVPASPAAADRKDPATAAAAEPPAAIAKRARDYIDAQAAKGITVSAAEAVDHVTKQAA
jgi:signal peptide peptidase SppA